MNETSIAAEHDEEFDVTVIGDAAALTMGGLADGGEGKRFVYQYTS
ncbi:hypothetical protein [Kitasatospora viridis]|uniref:Uncharacterized protein n=1 Tax=Kitasatospora viridis TaxID=281105 RepID=A0A561SFT9_9ACTN|nr:hypothetical protein [Kitasatospora viridis]TWF73719.1 hypothetical protein FHX73_15346 [Kitasatospora viridis]